MVLPRPRLSSAAAASRLNFRSLPALGAHLVRLAGGSDAVGPKAAIIRDGTSTMLAVATRDYRGLAASISGALWQSQVELRQAHLFSG